MHRHQQVASIYSEHLWLHSLFRVAAGVFPLINKQDGRAGGRCELSERQTPLIRPVRTRSAAASLLQAGLRLAAHGRLRGWQIRSDWPDARSPFHSPPPSSPPPPPPGALGCLLCIFVAPAHKPTNTAGLDACFSSLDLEFTTNLFFFFFFTMDATIYQIILGELGDLNCSLIDAFQDTFLGNASLSLLNTDGKQKKSPFLLVQYWNMFFGGRKSKV